MPKYRLDFVQLLARQMTFAPATVREKQLQAAESLLLSIDPAKAYPPGLRPLSASLHIDPKSHRQTLSPGWPCNMT